MKVKTRQKVLAKALTYAAKAASQKPNIPVLSNILLSASKDHLQLSATNLDMGINVWIGAVVEEEGKITSSAKFLSDFINAADGERVDISKKDDMLSIVADTAKAEMQTIPANEFPILPKVEGEPFFTMRSVDFVSSLNKVIYSCATDITTSKIQFTGVLFELDAQVKNSITFVGLSGFRMSKKIATISRESEDAAQIIVPARPLLEFVRIAASETSEEIKAYLSANKSQVIFQLEDLEFSIRLLEGPYPDYKSVLPKESNYTFEVEIKELEKAIKVVNTFARSSFGSRVLMDLDIESSTLLLHTNVSDLGNNEIRIPVSNPSGIHDLKDAYGLQFLQDLVNHTESDVIKFETKEALMPAVFTEKGDSSFLHLIMPMSRDD